MTPEEMRALAVDCVKDDGSLSDEWLIRMSGNAALWSSTAEVCKRLDTMLWQTKPTQRDPRSDDHKRCRQVSAYTAGAFGGSYGAVCTLNDGHSGHHEIGFPDWPASPRVGNQTLDYKRGVQAVVTMLLDLPQYHPHGFVEDIIAWAKREGMEVE